MTTKRTTPRVRPKMTEIPARMAKRVTLAVHVLEGIPDERLRAIATLPPGERLRGLLPDRSTWKASSSRHHIADPIDRAKARLSLVLDRLGKAKDLGDEQCPIDPADAEALYGLAWAALEDLGA